VTAATRDRLVFLTCLCAGAGLVDVPYPAAALGLAYALLLCVGFIASRAAWRWPLLLFGGAFLGLLALYPRGHVDLPRFVLCAVLGLVGLFPAYLGVALRRVRQRLRAARFAAAQRKAAGF